MVGNAIDECGQIQGNLKVNVLVISTVIAIPKPRAILSQTLLSSDREGAETRCWERGISY
ncbi:hypothetical protein [[Leptolyngbya] sp. PCC 7376]|uniref:hypothetical protein n=1 Tax=[Leptolyngbya] sp. PCC 7376 TaxID=111781 RepID=UPI0002ED3CC7|nr:hypothetical protein [[Leptolyngbya] sp. PCC 7376]